MLASRVRVTLLTVLLASSAVACSGNRAATEQPVFAPGAPSMSGLSAHPGALGVFSAYLAAGRARPITLERIVLLPLPGFRLPQLAHAALLEGGTYPARTLVWPPPGVRLRPLTGSVVWPAARAGKPPPELAYALTADGLGAYATAGIQLDYKIGGKAFTAVIRDAVFLWYFLRHLSPEADKADGTKYLAANARAYRTLRSDLTG
jgi:hypothetical protein